MKTRKTRDVTAALLRKGFCLREGDHSFFAYRRSSDSKKTSVFTKTSHGENELNEYLLRQMARQCKLSLNEFLDLVDCPLSQEEYETLLRKQSIDV
jgi:predicted RNA binding protein YcfA (HicA-like mRNA interferase family)